jgi:Gamma-butyrobetaine hydroxylase-like, N-terminal
MTEEKAQEPWPSELRLNPEKTALRVSFTDGVSESLAAEMLRVLSPSAEVRGHSPAERKLVAGKRHVTIRKIRDSSPGPIFTILPKGKRNFGTNISGRSRRRA